MILTQAITDSDYSGQQYGKSASAFIRFIPLSPHATSECRIRQRITSYRANIHLIKHSAPATNGSEIRSRR